MFDTQLMTGVYMNVLGQDASQFDESDQHPGGGSPSRSGPAHHGAPVSQWHQFLHPLPAD